jgi:nitroreductase
MTILLLDNLEAIIEERRTNLLMNRAQPVDQDLVVRLCGLIPWAPNHKRTWPWLIAIVSGEGRARLGEASAQDLLALGMSDEAKLEKTRGKYLRSPIVVAVGQKVAAHAAHAARAAEDRDAVAAGVQNFLLGATAAGLASYWGSASEPTGTHTLNVLGFQPDSRVSALIYLGWPSGAVPVPERPPLEIGLVD